MIGFFRSNQTDASIWQSTIAPAVSVAGLGGCLVIALSNLDLLTGSQGAIVWLLPAVIILTAAVGAFVAIRMRDRDSAQFARLGRSFLSETA